MKKLLLILLLLSNQKQFCMEQTTPKKHVFFDGGVTFEPNKLQRGSLIGAQLPRKGWIERPLPAVLLTAKFTQEFFGLCGFEIAEKKTFDFLREIPVEKEYYVVIYQGNALPPIMTAWLLQDLTPKQIQEKVSEYLSVNEARELQPFEEELQQITTEIESKKEDQASINELESKKRKKGKELNKKINELERKRAFYMGITYGTFDEEVNEKTTGIKKEAKNLLETHKDRITPYLLANLSRIRCPRDKKDAEVFDQFGDRMCISGEEKVLSPSSEFFDVVEKKFPGRPEDRIYLVAESPEERKDSRFDAARKFSHHIHRPTSPDLELLLREK